MSDELAVAWKRAETALSALPEGWAPEVGPWLDDRALGRRDDWRWVARPMHLELIHGTGRGDMPAGQFVEARVWPGQGYGSTPADALNALADLLDGGEQQR